MQFKKTWVLAANGAMARVFEFSKGHLNELEVLTHPETRMHGRDLVTDRPGSGSSFSGNGRSSMEPPATPQQNEAEHFAIEVARFLDLAHRKGSFQQLHIVASPAFLGLLRNTLHAETKKAVGVEVDKDLVEESPLQIRSYLP
ncbi:MAG: host attachment protein [Myxococcota bacterium]